MPVYEKAKPPVYKQIKGLVEKYHDKLEKEGVTIDVLMAEASADGDGCIAPDSHPVKLHGYPCIAMVKINSYKLRVQGHADAEIVLDKVQFEKQTEEQQLAILDHELQHLEVKTDKDGGTVFDGQERPKLRMRKHDQQFGWFNATARRHGKDSLEVRQFEAFAATRKQLWLGFEKGAA